MSTLSSTRRPGLSAEEAHAVACCRRGPLARDYGYQGYAHPGRFLGQHALRAWQKRRRNRWLRRESNRLATLPE